MVAAGPQREEELRHMYRSVPSATQTIYRRLREAEEREARWKTRTVAIATRSGHVVRTLPATRGGVLPASEGEEGRLVDAAPTLGAPHHHPDPAQELAALSTTPAIPLHILMRAAREEGFRLPPIDDQYSHSPLIPDGNSLTRGRRPRSAGRRGGRGRHARVSNVRVQHRPKLR
jgi:hypothetical protein